MPTCIVELLIAPIDPTASWPAIHAKGARNCVDTLSDFCAINNSVEASILLVGDDGRQFSLLKKGLQGLFLA